MSGEAKKIDVAKMHDKLETARVRLLYSQPLYALMLQKCTVKWDERVKTAGVSPRANGAVQLTIAPTFWESLPIEQCQGVLIHEMLHLFMDHFRRGKSLDKSLANVAMDIAINQYIDRAWLPSFALYPDTYSFSSGLNFERYYALLQDKQKDSDSGNVGDPLDNHEYKQGDGDGSGDGDEATADVSQAAAAEIGQNAVKECKAKFPGKLPNHIDPLLSDLTAKAKLNWKQELRRFVGRERAKDRENTRSRPNRRMGFFAEGNKPTYFPKIVIALDESGSVDSDSHERFLSEIKSILKNADGSTELLHFDTQIAKRETLRGVQTFKAARYASGGTDFNCVFEYARQARPDLLIVLTDGEASTPSVNYRSPVMWVLTGGNKGDHLKGVKVSID